MHNKKSIDNPNIRSMVPGDIGHILDIDEKLTGLQRTAHQAEIVTSLIGSADDLSLVAELEGIVVGFLIARMIYVGEAVIETASIRIIGVDPDYERHGIAAKMMDSLINNSRSRGINTVRVMLSEDDSKLEAFFKHIGFKPAMIKVYRKEI